MNNGRFAAEGREAAKSYIHEISYVDLITDESKRVTLPYGDLRRNVLEQHEVERTMMEGVTRKAALTSQEPAGAYGRSTAERTRTVQCSASPAALDPRKPASAGVRPGCRRQRSIGNSTCTAAISPQHPIRPQCQHRTRSLVLRYRTAARASRTVTIRTTSPQPLCFECIGARRWFKSARCRGRCHSVCILRAPRLDYWRRKAGSHCRSPQPGDQRRNMRVKWPDW